MRRAYLLLCTSLLLAGGLGATTSCLPLGTLPARGAAPVVQPRLALAIAIATDTVPPLTPAEERELRRLEREDARARRRRGEPTRRYDGYRSAPAEGGPNGLAVAALPAGLAGVLTFVIATSLWNPGPLIAISVAAFVCATVFGAIGLRRAKLERRRYRGLALAGMILGIVGVAFYTFILFLIATAF